MVQGKKIVSELIKLFQHQTTIDGADKKIKITPFIVGLIE